MTRRELVTKIEWLEQLAELAQEDGDSKTEHEAIAEIEELEDELGVMPYEFEEDEE